MNARWIPDHEVIRRRTGTLPEPTRPHKRRFTLQGSLVVLGLMVAAFLVGMVW